MKDYTLEELHDMLAYCTTEELWQIMHDLNIRYVDLRTTEKENLITKEKIEVPCFVPRTDYENMKNEIIVSISEKNRNIRRKVLDFIEKTYKKRYKIAAGDDMNGETI